MSIISAVAGLMRVGGAPDPSSPIYVGGAFATVVGTARARVAALSEDPDAAATLYAWNPGTGNDVYALVLDGDVLYMGGAFTLVEGTTRNRLAAVSSDPDTVTPTLHPWNPNANAEVNCLILSGAYFYIGGAFSTIGGTTRNALACVSSDVTAAATLQAWNPNVTGGTAILYCMLLMGVDLYIGGDFTSVNGSARGYAAALASAPATASPAVRAWTPAPSGSVRSFAIQGNYIILGGTFTLINLATRNRLAAVLSDTSIASPTVQPWNPNADGSVTSLVLLGADLYMAGYFGAVNGSSRLRLAAISSDLSIASPTVRAWNPSANGTVRALRIKDGVAWIGGSFTTLRGTARNRLGAVDADPSIAAPTLRTWNPNVSTGGGWVYDIVIAGGSFVGIISCTGTQTGSFGSTEYFGEYGMPAGIVTKIECNAYTNFGVTGTASVYVLDADRTIIEAYTGLTATRIAEIDGGSSANCAWEVTGSWTIPAGGGLIFGSQFGGAGRNPVPNLLGIYQSTLPVIGNTATASAYGANARYTFS